MELALSAIRSVPRPSVLRWALFAALLVAAPWLAGNGSGLTILSQLGVVTIFALSYNMLLGQGGMLSFGHSVYSGLAAFCVAHAMNAAAGPGRLPLPLVPLLGALAGIVFGLAFGWLSTRKAGMSFAMITLGLVELVHSCALMIPEFFGGEAGVSTNRVYGEPILGMTFGPQIQVYYLIAAWLFGCTALMYGFTRTPLGRVLNAVRDNPERAEFIGYNPRVVRYLALVGSAAFAGVAGALSVINFEIVNGENVSVAGSGAILLFTFIGGTGYFFGPMLGAAAGVLMTVVVAAHTPAWPLYLGVVFILVVVYAPGGLASLVVLTAKVIREGETASVAAPFARAAGCAVISACAGVALVEMTYYRTLDVGAGSSVARLFGMSIETRAPGPWIVAVAALAAGLLAFVVARRSFRRAWNATSARLEAKSLPRP